LWLHSLKVAQLLRSAACLHTNQSRSYLNNLVFIFSSFLVKTADWKTYSGLKCTKRSTNLISVQFLFECSFD